MGSRVSMKKFIHQSTRVNSEIFMAYQMFTKKEKIELWLCDEATVADDHYELQMNDEKFSFNNRGSRILSKNRDEKIVIEWHDEGVSEVEINFMQCSSRTKFCTEIHVLHKGLSTVEQQQFYQQFWQEALDTLRYYYNKDWVITDRDLTLTKLTGRSW